MKKLLASVWAKTSSRRSEENPHAAPSVKASAATSAWMPAQRLLMSLTVLPLPGGPRCSQTRPSAAITGWARAKASSSPPTMKVIDAARAPSTPVWKGSPPLTGASR